MSTLRVNTLESADFRAVLGPVPQPDGRVAAVVKNDQQQWHYTLASLNPSTKPDVGPAVATPDEARAQLAKQLGGPEKKAWTQEPFTPLEPGQPWFRQRVGERQVPPEVVFARACFTQNVDLAMASSERLSKPNAVDANGTSLLVYAAGLKDSREPMDALLEKGADPRRTGTHGWSPAHAAAAIGEADRVVTLAKAGASVHLPNKEGKTPLALLEPSERKRIEPQLPQPKGPAPNPSALSNRSLPPRPSRAPSRGRGRDVRSF